MNYFKKISILSVSLFLILGSQAYAKSTTPPAPSKKLVDKIAAVVNQDIILNSEFETFRKGMEDEFKKSSDPISKAEVSNPETFQKKVLNQMIENHLVEQEIKAMGLEATDSQVENVIAEIMKTNGLQSRKELERALRGEGVTYDEFVSEYRKFIWKNIRQYRT